MSEQRSRAPITPELRVARLLADYPELEDVLIGLSPTYKKLKNPVLRRTVAKVATLRQVAQVGGLSVATLVNRLREAAGEDHLEVAGEGGEAAARPGWAAADKVARSLDARPVIEQGDHPLEQVMRGLDELGEGEVFELVTPFVPAPLIDLADRKGYEAHTVREADELFRTYFRRR